MPGFQPATSVVSSQVNYGPVSATASGAPMGFSVGAVRGSMMTISNNTIAAAAYGNLATNMIAVTR